MATTSFQVADPKFGEFIQIVGDTPQEAGHEPLLGPKGEWLGWIMPVDPALELLLSQTKDKTILEIGSGNGHRVIIPSLKNGAQHCYSVDIFSEHIHVIHEAARGAGYLNRVTVGYVERQWWENILPQPTLNGIFSVIEGSLPSIPVDVLVARQVLQFAARPENLFVFFDIAALILSIGGKAWGINMSPYLQYIYECRFDINGSPANEGERLEQIIMRNQNYAKFISELPGSFTSDLSVCLSEASSNPFLYFDEFTLDGLFSRWKQSRVQRDLPVNIEITENFCFASYKIWRKNKLVGRLERMNREQHCFVLTRMF